MTKQCPPCHGNCNQGRACPAVRRVNWHFAFTLACLALSCAGWLFLIASF